MIANKEARIPDSLHVKVKKEHVISALAWAAVAEKEACETHVCPLAHAIADALPVPVNIEVGRHSVAIWHDHKPVMYIHRANLPVECTSFIDDFDNNSERNNYIPILRAFKPFEFDLKLKF